MSTLAQISNLGDELARRLDLRITGRSGNNLTGPCVACKSSDAFYLDKSRGIAHCFSCGGGWSPFALAEQVLGNRQQAIDLMTDLGVFEPRGSTGGSNYKRETAPPRAKQEPSPGPLSQQQLASDKEKIRYIIQSHKLLDIGPAKRAAPYIRLAAKDL